MAPMIPDKERLDEKLYVVVPFKQITKNNIIGKMLRIQFADAFYRFTPHSVKVSNKIWTATSWSWDELESDHFWCEIPQINVGLKSGNTKFFAPNSANVHER